MLVYGGIPTRGYPGYMEDEYVHSTTFYHLHRAENGTVVHRHSQAVMVAVSDVSRAAN